MPPVVISRRTVTLQMYTVLYILNFLFVSNFGLELS